MTAGNARLALRLTQHLLHLQPEIRRCSLAKTRSEPHYGELAFRYLKIFACRQKLDDLFQLHLRHADGVETLRLRKTELLKALHVRSTQHINHHAFAEPSAQLLHATHDRARFRGDINRPEPAFAVRAIVARTIILLRCGLIAEVAQHIATQAFARQAIALHSRQHTAPSRAGNLSFLGIHAFVAAILLKEEPARGQIAIAPVEHALAGKPVAPRAASFLIIGFDA